MKKIFNLLKEKFSKFNFKIFLFLFCASFIVNLFSGFLADIVLVTSLVYLVAKGIVPKVKTISSKITNFFKPKFNKIKEMKKGKNRKKFNLFKSKKKNTNKEKDKTFEKTNEDLKEITETKKEKKSIPNLIKNFKLVSTNKFKLNLKVKRDINGCKIVDGSYRIKGNKIIDTKINLYTLEPIVDNETTYSHKTYVKTK